MANTYSSIVLHCAFSTKNREPTIADDLRDRLWAYIGGIARENEMKALAVGGTSDHAHVLLSLPPTISVSKTLQLVKGGSSKWIHDNFPHHASFEWQTGYGAFTIGVSQIPATVAYIKNQATHHRKATFQEEYVAFLTKHGVSYDERYVWG
jgi:putative transposase